MRFLLSVFMLFYLVGASVAQEAKRDVMVVFDMSGSMWGQVDGIAKVEIARDAFGGLLSDWDAGNIQAGLIAYGHRRRGDCTDIELLAQPGAGADIAALIANLQPRGKTPLSDAVRQAAEVLKYTEEAATVVLLSDGVETCDADPCAVGAELEALGLDFTAHVIGFDIAETDRAQLQCLADATGGQYFDAANANGLADAMQGVVVATTTPAVAAPEVQNPALHPVVIQVFMPNSMLALPEEVTVYNGDQQLGKLLRGQHVTPGLAVDLPLGTNTLRVEGKAITSNTTVEITTETRAVQLDAVPDVDTYVVWREGQFPVTEEQQLILIKNTTGVNRTSTHYVFMYPAGSTDKNQRVRMGNIGPQSGVFHEVKITPPVMPGDYELVPTGFDDVEYGRIPVSFAAEITPTWQGPREVAVAGNLDAYWAGSSRRYDGYEFWQNGSQVGYVSQRVSGMARSDGFKLVAPEVAGLYDLVFITDYESNAEFKEVPFGQIAVGVPLPADPITQGIPEEAEAMGGEEANSMPVGDLHGDWELVFQNNVRTIPLFLAQLFHEADTPSGEGSLFLQAHPDWGFGPIEASGTMILTHAGDDTLTMTVSVPGGDFETTLARNDVGWAGALQTGAGDTHNVVLIRADDMATAKLAIDAAPIEHQLKAADERGAEVEQTINWTIQSAANDTVDIAQSTDSRTEMLQNVPGNYVITATSGDLFGTDIITLERGLPRANVLVMKPKSEGADLALDVTYYCTAGEDCDMQWWELPIYFTLPDGWGAEKPFAQRDGNAQFTMTTNTVDGPFFTTLNFPQRAADLGPCTQLISGTFCHDATDDPDLLANIAILQRSLSFKPTGQIMTTKEVDTLILQLTGAAE
jgi:Ca-activated chloride channel family protein